MLAVVLKICFVPGKDGSIWFDLRTALPSEMDDLRLGKVEDLPTGFPCPPAVICILLIGKELLIQVANLIDHCAADHHTRPGYPSDWMRDVFIQVVQLILSETAAAGKTSRQSQKVCQYSPGGWFSPPA